MYKRQNKTHASVTYELTDTDACSAITDCANMADTGTSYFYRSFDVHYLISSASWECTIYYKSQNSTFAQYFDVANANVGAVYGFADMS